MDNPVLNKVVSEQVRPMAEKARNLLILAQATKPGIDVILAQLVNIPDDEIINDNRLNEGIAPITVGQFRACAGVLSDLLVTVNTDPRLLSILGVCVRSPDII